MDHLTETILAGFAQFFFPFTRISCMLMTMTFLGARFVPPRIRLYLSLAITFAVMPVLPEIAAQGELLSLANLILLLQQVLIGIAMGTISQFIGQTFVLLGQIIGMQSSLGFASLVDPANGQSTPLLGQFYLFLVTLLFLALDGHLQMLVLIVDSFKSLPVGESLRQADYRSLASWFGIMFHTALSMSLATIVALLTINISFGIMTRAAPQLNIFSLGFAFVLLVGLFLTMYFLKNILPQYQMHWQSGTSAMCELLRQDCGPEV
ncbi:MAG: flagellar biosynthetic protein FliR [Enterovibrio sp.]